MPEHKPSHRLRHWLLWPLIVAAAIALFWWSTRDAPVSVGVYTVAAGTVQSTVANTRAGTVDACRRARIAPASGGQVSRLAVKEGERVTTGQVLIELWNNDLSAQLVLSEREADAAKARMDDACLRADVADREAQRLKRMHERGLASDERRDQAVTEAQAQAAACRAARATLAVSAARIAVNRAALNKTILNAPFDGIVAEVYPEVGEFVTPSPPGIPTPPAVDLIDDSCMYVTAPIDEVDAAGVKTGLRTVITLDAMRDRKFAGTVHRVAPYVQDRQKQARTVDVEVRFDDPAEIKSLLTGYSADVEIVLQEREGVLRVPTEAITESNRVLILENGVIVERQFEPGLSNWRFTEIRSGIKAGELVITGSNREGVKPGVRAVVRRQP